MTDIDEAAKARTDNTLAGMNGTVKKMEALVPPQRISPTPWKLVDYIEHYATICDARGEEVASRIRLADAERILKAAKFHAPLLGAMRHLAGEYRHAVDVRNARELIAEVMAFSPEYVE